MQVSLNEFPDFFRMGTFEEIYCHSNSSEIPSADAGEKNSLRGYDNNA